MARPCWLAINVEKQSGLFKKQKNVSFPSRILTLLKKKISFILKGMRRLYKFMKEMGKIAKFMKEIDKIFGEKKKGLSSSL